MRKAGASDRSNVNRAARVGMVHSGMLHASLRALAGNTAPAAS
jgi:hypothetical protein